MEQLAKMWLWRVQNWSPIQGRWSAENESKNLWAQTQSLRWPESVWNEHTKTEAAVNHSSRNLGSCVKETTAATDSLTCEIQHLTLPLNSSHKSICAKSAMFRSIHNCTVTVRHILMNDHFQSHLMSSPSQCFITLVPVFLTSLSPLPCVFFVSLTVCFRLPHCKEDMNLVSLPLEGLIRWKTSNENKGNSRRMDGVARYPPEQDVMLLTSLLSTETARITDTFTPIWIEQGLISKTPSWRSTRCWARCCTCCTWWKTLSTSLLDPETCAPVNSGTTRFRSVEVFFQRQALPFRRSKRNPGFLFPEQNSMWRWHLQNFVRQCLMKLHEHVPTSLWAHDEGSDGVNSVCDGDHGGYALRGSVAPAKFSRIDAYIFGRMSCTRVDHYRAHHSVQRNEGGTNTSASRWQWGSGARSTVKLKLPNLRHTYIYVLALCEDVRTLIWCSAGHSWLRMFHKYHKCFKFCCCFDGETHRLVSSSLCFSSSLCVVSSPHSMSLLRNWQ